MKSQSARNKCQAFTLIELLVVIVIFMIFFALIGFGPLSADKRKARTVVCINNLKQIGVAFRFAEDDRGSNSLPLIPTDDLSVPGQAWVFWQTLSNQSVAPKILWCPADTRSIPTTSFSTGFSDTNISYFASLDARESHPHMILAGDDNLLIGGQPVRSGRLNVPTHGPIQWSPDRHGGVGNVGMADGSAQQIASSGFPKLLTQVTNGIPAPESSAGEWLIP